MNSNAKRGIRLMVDSFLDQHGIEGSVGTGVMDTRTRKGKMVERFVIEITTDAAAAVEEDEE